MQLICTPVFDRNCIRYPRRSSRGAAYRTEVKCVILAHGDLIALLGNHEDNFVEREIQNLEFGLCSWLPRNLCEVAGSKNAGRAVQSHHQKLPVSALDKVA